MEYQYPPNDSQRRAIESGAGPVRVISGPGSGKTFVQGHRFVKLVEEGVNPESILLVVFNRRNADEMKERVFELLSKAGFSASGNWITTIHAACFAIFRAEAEGTFPGSDQYEVLDSETRWFPQHKFSLKSFIQEKAEELWPNPDYRPGWKEVWAVILSSKMAGLVPAESGAYFIDWLGESNGQKIYRLYLDLWADMKRMKLLTFADMLLLVDVQLQRNQQFRERWQGQFSHVLVDEFQDVSEQAMRILSILGQPQNNFFAVGDQDQLLYRFTGATPEVNLLDGFEERYPDHQTILMGTNYRSENTVIIEKAKELIANNYSAQDGPYDQKYMKDLSAKPGAIEGQGIGFVAYEDAAEEASGVANSIKALVDSGTEPGQIFVGARTRAQLGYLEGPLMKLNVPFLNITGGSFWTAKHVADVVAYLSIAQDKGDKEAFKRIYNIASNWMTVPWKKSEHYGEYCTHRYLGAQFFNECNESWDGMYQAENGRNGWRYREGIADLKELVWGIEAKLAEGPAAAINEILDRCYIKWLRMEEGLTSGDESENGKLEDLQTVAEIAAGFNDVPEFLSYVAQVKEAAEAAKDGDWDQFVILSTVHRLKGLERDVVFGVGWGEGLIETKDGVEPRGLLPHTFSLMQPPQFGIFPAAPQGRVEDERCLAFVLITRARQSVYLSYPRKYRGAKFEPSRFAVEMGLVMVDQAPDPEPGPKDEVEDEGVGFPYSEMSDEEIDLAFEIAEKEFVGPKHDLREPPPGSNEWVCRVCGEIVTAWGWPQNTGQCPGPSVKATVESASNAASLYQEWADLIEGQKPDYRNPVFIPQDQDQGQGQEEGILSLFPDTGRFEGNIYRPSAQDLIEWMPDFTATIDRGQLVLTKDLAEGITVFVYTSILIGKIAGGTADDSIRVTRRDRNYKGDGYFWFKNHQNWITRRVPKEVLTQDRPEQAASQHLVNKIRDQIDQMVRECPVCDKLQIKCKSGRGRDVRYWWKGTDGCQCRS